mmetsp:Transcript_11551/g.22815  ORF Transcript_11551/g.22815 Transcript_11551/m.22815 type:complete len:202 (-) Transcript_11551:334-939(-)
MKVAGHRLLPRRQLRLPVPRPLPDPRQQRLALVRRRRGLRPPQRGAAIGRGSATRRLQHCPRRAGRPPCRRPSGGGGAQRGSQRRHQVLLVRPPPLPLAELERGDLRGALPRLEQPLPLQGMYIIQLRLPRGSEEDVGRRRRALFAALRACLQHVRRQHPRPHKLDPPVRGVDLLQKGGAVRVLIVPSSHGEFLHGNPRPR